MADTYAKLLGLSDAPPLPSDSGRTIPAQKPSPGKKTDARTQMEEPKKLSAPFSVAIIPGKSEQNTLAKAQTGDAKKSTKPQTHLPLNQSPAFELIEKLEKYTTHLEPSLIKKLKLHATEKDMKDYQVVRNALLLYFEKNK